MKKMIFLGVLTLALLVAGCAKTPTGNVVATDSSYQELCKSNGNMFMVMSPTVDGVPTGDEPCAGCMISGTHYCSMDDYINALAEGNGKGSMDMGDMKMG